MAKDFATDFYNSKAWRETRAMIWARDFGLCARCGEPGAVVHHKEHLTPRNIGIQHIALGADNLETLCRDCHAIEHEGELPADRGLMFDGRGELVERNNACQRQ